MARVFRPPFEESRRRSLPYPKNCHFKAVWRVFQLPSAMKRPILGIEACFSTLSVRRGLSRCQARATVHPPAVREIAALLRPGGVDAAATRFIEEFAGPVRRFLQGQLGAVAGQNGVPADELRLAQPQGGGGGGDVRRLQQHRSGPAAASAAPAANEGGHGNGVRAHGYCMYMRSPPGPIMMGFFSSCSSQATLMFRNQASARARWKTL